MHGSPGELAAPGWARDAGLATVVRRTVQLARRTGDASGFWLAQVAVWSAYAAALMLPWLGTYPVSMMLPSKMVIGATGLLLSTGLAVLTGVTSRRVPSRVVQLAIAVIAAIVAGLIWDLAIVALIGHRDSVLSIASLEAGVPRFSGGIYGALVMLTWQLGYLGVRATLTPPLDAAARTGSAAATAPARVEARDGRRTIFLDPAAIRWIAAEGDYVRVHTGARSLLLRDSIGRWEQILGPTHRRIHRSTIVNLACIRELRPATNRDLVVVLDDGVVVRASRTYVDRLSAAIARR